MKITLYKRKFKFIPAWEFEGKCIIKTEVKLELMVNKWFKFSFIASVPNKSFSNINPFNALMTALESQTVGMLKYDRLKDRIREMKQWQKL
jgi:hypothetical protein